MTLALGWYVPTKGTPRWLLATANDHVLYSNGRKQRECQVKTFRRWMRKSKAALGGALLPSQETSSSFSLCPPPTNSRSRPWMHRNA